MNSLWVGSYRTVQPAWGHTASKARNVPACGWTTSDGSPDEGSWNDAAPPTGTSRAGPILVPDGRTAAGVVGPWEPAVCPSERATSPEGVPASRPSPAAAAPDSNANAETTPAAALLATNVRRSS